MSSRFVTLNVPANPDVDDCLTEAARAYVAEHRDLEGHDLCPCFADSSRETISLTVPRWHYESISDTSGT